MWRTHDPAKCLGKGKGKSDSNKGKGKFNKKRTPKISLKAATFDDSSVDDDDDLAGGYMSE